MVFYVWYIKASFNQILSRVSTRFLVPNFYIVFQGKLNLSFKTGFFKLLTMSYYLVNWLYHVLHYFRCRNSICWVLCLLLVWEEDFQSNFNQLWPQWHRKDHYESKEVKFLVNCPPFVKAEENKWYETITGNDECVHLQNYPNDDLYISLLFEFLELWILLKHWLNLVQTDKIMKNNYCLYVRNL